MSTNAQYVTDDGHTVSERGRYHSSKCLRGHRLTWPLGARSIYSPGQKGANNWEVFCIRESVLEFSFNTTSTHHHAIVAI